MQFLSWLFGGGSGAAKEPEKSEDEAPVVSTAAKQPIKGSTTGTVVRWDPQLSLSKTFVLGLIVLAAKVDLRGTHTELRHWWV